MNLTAPSDHSNFIGGSNAAARIACPASWQMEQKLPVEVRKESSVYADEGSAIHAAMADALNNDLSAFELLGKVYPKYEAYPITQTLIDDAIQPCLDYFDELDQVLDGLEFYVEKKVSLPFLPGVFGTADLIGRSSERSVVGDWKFGVGELVQAWYEEEDGTIIPNEQLMFYLLGATLTCPEMFKLEDPDWPITIFIGQPRHRDGPNFDAHEVFMRQVTEFRDRLRRAAAEAKSDNPPMKKGDHCRFMPCKSICPLHTGPLLDIPELTRLTGRMQFEAAVGGGEAGALEVAAADWGHAYSLMLDLANRIEPVLREWRAQAQTYLETGGTIPDWKLVDKRASRKWVRPEKSVERRLQRMGLDKNQRMPRTLISPPQAEKLLKPLGKSLPKDYVDAISSGTTLAPAADPRQAAKPVGDIVLSLATALSALRGEH